VKTMTEHQKHWTEEDVESYVYRIAFDFVTYVSSLLKTGSFAQVELAQRLGVSEGRVSQILNSPGNLTLKQIVKIARALDRKVSIVSYDDNDPGNANGPIASGVFTACWEHAGRPVDFFAVDACFAINVTPTNQIGIQSIIKIGAEGLYVSGQALLTNFLVMDLEQGQSTLTTFAKDAANSYSRIQTDELSARAIN